MDIYEKQDNKGREIFKGYCKSKGWCKHHKDSTQQFSHWDTSYFSANTYTKESVMVIAEIKERNYSSQDYTDWYGEVYKYNELMKIKDKQKSQGKDVRIHYINLFNDNVVLIWDITDITLEGFKMNLAKTTLENNGTREKQMYRLWKCQSIIWDDLTSSK